MLSVKITLFFAAILGLINLWLSWRAGKIRVSDKIAIGDGDHELLRARMRAHANFNEYVPLALVLMALIEIQTGAATPLWVLARSSSSAASHIPSGWSVRPPTCRAAGAYC